MDAEARHLEHLTWLAEVSSGTDPAISPGTAARSAAAWAAIRAAVPGMPVPAAGTGPDGHVLYCWDLGRHHLELEVFEAGPLEWFYRDRTVVRESWDEDWSEDETLDPAAIERLLLFVGEGI